ncbi:MAG TPA: 4-hydroxy-tetrahydrodipicolinate reductase [Flavisolibacter sp.]|nr:4-hydroxy-tetrahydrodipicolinate reductase [Flavisolibacter sp.]
MKIALIGYGKMGHMIEEIALERGHEIILRISIDNTGDFNKTSMTGTDVAIEFTGPDSAYDNVIKCLDLDVPVVSGSTGWNDRLQDAKEYCWEKKGSFLHASNFSIGVNIFFEVNKLLARLMAGQPSYQVSINEIHHTQKKDAPSGTAVTLAEQVIGLLPGKQSWVNSKDAGASEIAITSQRIDPAPGTHEVSYTSEIDDIQIIHTAHNRKGFALGAVLAAEFIASRKGVFSMQDVLDL